MRRNHLRWANKQRGMSKWGWLFVAVLVVSFMTAALRLGPHYIDFRLLQSVLERLPADDVHQEMSRADISEFMRKQMRVENFQTPVKDIMKIQRDREKTVVNIDYEVREHLFYNVDVVLVFSDQRTFQ